MYSCKKYIDMILRFDNIPYMPTKTQYIVFAMKKTNKILTIFLNCNIIMLIHEGEINA